MDYIRPQTLEDSVEFARAGDVEKGRDVFYAGGCASCLSAPKSIGDAKFMLTGVRAFTSPFGTFYAPNISPDPQYGIGNWSSLDLPLPFRFRRGLGLWKLLHLNDDPVVQTPAKISRDQILVESLGIAANVTHHDPFLVVKHGSLDSGRPAARGQRPRPQYHPARKRTRPLEH